jgi:hypothetical protein
VATEAVTAGFVGTRKMTPELVLLWPLITDCVASGGRRIQGPIGHAMLLLRGTSTAREPLAAI